MTHAEEKELIAQCKKDPVAFGKIYDAHFDPIFQYVLYRLGNVTVAEDLTAQTFYKALDSLWKFRWTGVSIGAWLYRIATNEVNGFLRKNKRRSYTDLDTMIEQLPADTDTPDAELEAAEAELHRQEAFLALNQCIQKLKPEEQALLTLRYFNNKPYSEIADIIGKREGTLRMRTKRALEKLKSHLQQEGIEYGEYGEISITNPQAGRDGQKLSPGFAAESP